MALTWNYTPIAIPLFAGTILLLATSLLAWRRRHVPGALYLVFVGIGLAISSLSYGIELGSSDIAAVRLMYKLFYLGSLTNAIFLPLMLIDFLGRRGLITRRAITLLAAVPLICMALAWTNDWHQLIWQNIRLDRSAGFTIATFNRGALYFLPNGYGLILLGTMLFFLARAWVEAASGHRPPIALMMIGILLPELSFGLSLVGLVPAGLSVSTYLYVVSALIFAISMFRRRMFEVPPIMHRSIYQILPNPIFIFDSNGRLADINPAGEELFGLAAGHSIGKEASALLARWPNLVAIYNQPANADIIQRVTINGEEHTLQVRTLRLRSSSGVASGHTMVVRDISREIRAEEAQRLANTRLLILHHVDNDLNLKLDVDYVATVALNAAMLLSRGDAAVIGFAAGEWVIALKTSGLYGAEHTGKRMDTGGVTGRALKTRTPQWVRNVAADHDYIRRIPGMKSQIAVPLMAGARVIGIISVETDKPERFTENVFESIQLLATRVATALDNARAYQERDQLVSELDAFAHTVAHDLKSPIGVVAGYAEILVERHASMPTDQVDGMLQLIQDRSLKMADIINSLLMLASVRGISGLAIAPLDIDAIVKDAMQRLDHLIGEKQAVITTAKDWPGAVGFTPWIEEIMVNYISNALKYGGSPPHIHIDGQITADNMARFNVTDNGPGLTEKDQARLFTPFTRLESTGKSEGHGLGLSIVERITARLGGTAGVESEIGKGSTFYFTLPAVTRKAKKASRR